MKDSGLADVALACESRRPSVRSEILACLCGMLMSRQRSRCRTSRQPSQLRSSPLSTDSRSGCPAWRSCILHGCRSWPCRVCTLGFTRPLSSDWRRRTSVYAMKSRRRRTSTRRLRRYLGANDRLDRCGCCGKYLACRKNQRSSYDITLVHVAYLVDGNCRTLRAH